MSICRSHSAICCTFVHPAGHAVLSSGKADTSAARNLGEDADMSADSRLNAAFAHAPTFPLCRSSRYVLFSDCHRGCGTNNDNFLKNQNLYFAALQHYYNRGFTYIELGDGDELWENRSFEAIKGIHNNTFWLLSRLYQEGRLIMLYGNHDIVKRKKTFVRRSCSSYLCSTSQERELFPGIIFYSGAVLKNTDWGRDVYLTHGHQADFFNSVLWRTSRFLVRYIWKPLESTGFLDPTSAAKNNTKKKKVERTLTGWAEKNDCILVTGHTHRPMLDESVSYCNSGSCVHPRCITCMEIEQLKISLVKWTLGTHPDRTLYVAREVLSGPFYLR